MLMPFSLPSPFSITRFNFFVYKYNSPELRFQPWLNLYIIYFIIIIFIYLFLFLFIYSFIFVNFNFFLQFKPYLTLAFLNHFVITLITQTGRHTCGSKNSVSWTYLKQAKEADKTAPPRTGGSLNFIRLLGVVLLPQLLRGENDSK